MWPRGRREEEADEAEEEVHRHGASVVDPEAWADPSRLLVSPHLGPWPRAAPRDALQQQTVDLFAFPKI